MSAAIQPMPLADAIPGMVLSDALRDARGNVLLAEGVVLTEAMLAALARHGIAALPILGAAPPAVPVDRAAVRARLDQLFRGQAQEDPARHAGPTLRRLVEAYRLNGGSGTPGAPA